MALDWAESHPTLMGWNQTVRVAYDARGISSQVMKVRDFNVGINQRFDVPDMVTGATDRLTWSKGLLEVGGSISAPLTASFADTVVQAAVDAAVGEGYLDLTSTVHGTTQAKVNTMKISVESEGPIEVTADLFGRLTTSDIQSGTWGTDSVSTTLGGTTESYGGADPTGLLLEQIPMFDQVEIDYTMIPGGDVNYNYLMPIGCTFNIDNKLIRNYILGSVENGSSLNAISISSGQRVLNGTMRFQSGITGQIGYIRTAGASETGTAENFLNFADLIKIKGAGSYIAIWSAAPPQLNTGKVIIELEYQLVAETAGFWITVGDNPVDI